MSKKDFAVGVLVGGIAGALTGIVISKCCEEKKSDCLGIDDDEITSNEEIESDEETPESDNGDEKEGTENE